MSRIANLLNRPTSAELRRHHGSPLSPCCLCEWPLFSVTPTGRVLCCECHPTAKHAYRLIVIDSPSGQIGWDISIPRPEAKPPAPNTLTLFGAEFTEIEPGRYLRNGATPAYPLGADHDEWWDHPAKFWTPIGKKSDSEKCWR